MGVYKEMQLQRRDKRLGGPEEGPAIPDPVREMATKLAWAVGSTLKESYTSGTPLKVWASGMAQRIFLRSQERRSKSGAHGPR